MWEEATWLGGETCLLFGSTMKLGRQGGKEENPRETPTEKNTKGNGKYTQGPSIESRVT